MCPAEACPLTRPRHIRLQRPPARLAGPCAPWRHSDDRRRRRGDICWHSGFPCSAWLLLGVLSGPPRHGQLVGALHRPRPLRKVPLHCHQRGDACPRRQPSERDRPCSREEAPHPLRGQHRHCGATRICTRNPRQLPRQRVAAPGHRLLVRGCRRRDHAPCAALHSGRRSPRPRPCPLLRALAAPSRESPSYAHFLPRLALTSPGPRPPQPGSSPQMASPSRASGCVGAPHLCRRAPQPGRCAPLATRFGSRTRATVGGRVV